MVPSGINCLMLLGIRVKAKGGSYVYKLIYNSIQSYVRISASTDAAEVWPCIIMVRQAAPLRRLAR